MSLFLSRTLWRSGLLKAVISLLILSTTVAFFLSSTDIGAKNKLFFDLLLFIHSFFLHLVALLFAYELTKNDASSKLSRVFLATKFSRNSYELSRFLAVAVAMLPLGATLIALDLIVATPLVAYQGFLYLLSSVLTGFLVLTLSRFVLPTAATLYALAIMVIGNGLDELYIYATITKDSGLDLIAKLLYVAMPNFSIYDRSSEVVAGVVHDATMFFAVPNLYFLLLGGGLLALSSWRFKRQAI